MDASGISPSDLAFLEAVRARLSDDDWRAMLSFGEVLADRAVQDELKVPMLALLGACARMGTQIAFERASIRDDLHRLYTTEGVVRLTLHKPPGGRSPVTGVTFEGKALPEDSSERPRQKGA